VVVGIVLAKVIMVWTVVQIEAQISDSDVSRLLVQGVVGHARKRRGVKDRRERLVVDIGGAAPGAEVCLRAILWRVYSPVHRNSASLGRRRLYGF
jgi:hypothetical protein